MFKRVLIANRGEIAVRIIRACEELDIETVAIFSEADENALHVQLADHAVCVGGADATDSYLNKDSILRAALETGADAIHPGYGFLSEDADFAQQVTEHGITWIGPMPETIRLVGDKDVARASMQPSGIPMAKGSEPLKNNKEAVKAAKEVGYPVILKPVSGGGGKGMYVAHDEDELKDILDTLVDLKKINYYFEHYIERSRHIEVQIVADNYGEVIHLGERECSIQRRNQKLLEESPSIALTHEMRKQVGTLAVKAAKSVHYSNVGTVEFLLDLKDNQFYFMEINPRIQVEFSERFTLSTSSACAWIDMFLWIIPIPPCLAIAMAILCSVTVSMAALIIGIFKTTFLVRCVVRSIMFGVTSEYCGTNNTSSKVIPSPIIVPILFSSLSSY